MATPHIGGIATLLLAAAPSLGVASYQVEDHDHLDSMYFNDSAKGIQFDDWDDRNESKVHEVELILELTSHYGFLRNSCEDGNDDDSCDDIPMNAISPTIPIAATIESQSWTSRYRSSTCPGYNDPSDEGPRRRWFY